MELISKSAFKGSFTPDGQVQRQDVQKIPPQQRNTGKTHHGNTSPTSDESRKHTPLPTDQSHATHGSDLTGNHSSVCQNGTGGYRPMMEPLKSFSFIIFWPSSRHLDYQVSSTPPDQTWWVTWQEARSPLFLPRSNWGQMCVPKQSNKMGLRKDWELDLIVKVDIISE